MNDENITDAGDTTVVNETATPTAAEGEPKKLLIGKRIVRHFNVKTAIQTGYSSIRVRCK